MNYTQKFLDNINFDLSLFDKISYRKRNIQRIKFIIISRLEGKTLSYIGKQLKVTPERIRQLEYWGCDILEEGELYD